MSRGNISLGKLFLVALLAVGGYGGYFGYSRYQAGDKLHAFSEATQGLRQALLKINASTNQSIGPEQLRGVVERMANEAGVEIVPGSLELTIELLDDHNIDKLPVIARTALGMAGKIARHETPQWLVGFRGQFLARQGPAKLTELHERYTYFERAAP